MFYLTIYVLFKSKLELKSFLNFIILHNSNQFNKTFASQKFKHTRERNLISIKMRIQKKSMVYYAVITIFVS